MKKATDLTKEDFYEYITDRVTEGYNCPVCKRSVFPSVYNTVDGSSTIAFSKMDFTFHKPPHNVPPHFDGQLFLIPCVCSNCSYISYFSALDVVEYLNAKRGV